jgi:hypothetical protein
VNHELATALNQIIAQATPATAEQSIEDAFATLLAGTTPQPAPRHPVRCPVTGGVYAFVATAEEAQAWNDRLAA